MIAEEDEATSPGAEESRAWADDGHAEHGEHEEHEVPKLKSKYGLPGEEGFENVWGEASEHPHGEPKENP